MVQIVSRASTISYDSNLASIGKVIAKIIPWGCNFAAIKSPYLIGYGTSQLPNDIDDVAEKLNKHH